MLWNSVKKRRQELLNSRTVQAIAIDGEYWGDTAIKKAVLRLYNTLVNLLRKSQETGYPLVEVTGTFQRSKFWFARQENHAGLIVVPGNRNIEAIVEQLASEVSGPTDRPRLVEISPEVIKRLSELAVEHLGPMGGPLVEEQVRVLDLADAGDEKYLVEARKAEALLEALCALIVEDEQREFQRKARAIIYRKAEGGGG